MTFVKMFLPFLFAMFGDLFATLLLLELCSADAAPTDVGVVSGRTPLCHGNRGVPIPSIATRGGR
ncbi:MAG: hypothetical protein GY696_30910 [Gammaproteobacteria bacterium]|nr:hypothetical protein [Gammaproteobacteria bacterium]